MARLYPPITEETLPAFCLIYNEQQQKVSATIKVNFNLNKAVAGTEVSDMVLRLRTVSTDRYVIDEHIKENLELGRSEGQALAYDLKNGTCVFTLTNQYNPEKMEYIKVGQYYKLQIAFVDQNNEIGYWSTVATIKCIARPSATIGNFQDNDANVFMNEFIGNYKQDTNTGDSSEKAYSYRFQLFDTDRETILEDTGVLLHNSINDTKANESEDKYYCFRELSQDQVYYLQYSVITVNGYETVSPLYQIVNVGSIDPAENIGLLASIGNEEYYTSELDWLPSEEGLVKLQIIFNNYMDRTGGKKLMGNFVITRSSSRDNFVTWQEVARLRFNEDIPQSRVVYDYTTEQGVKYRYAVQQYNRHGFYSNKVYCYERDSNLNIKQKNNAFQIREVVVDFEDMFLYDGEKQLKIRFNPKVNTFKNDLQEQKIDTIGSKYPFIFKNGNVCYKEFPISGLISFQQDNAMFFMDNNDYQQMDLDRFEIPADERSRRYGEVGKYVKFTKSQILESDLPLYYQDTKTRIVSKKSNHENLQNIGNDEIEEYIDYIKIETTGEAVRIKNTEGKQLYTIEYTSLSQKVSDRVYSDIYRGQTYEKTDLTGDNMASERYFKLKILEWLTNGEPKLFRSPAEGNYVVRLMNVSLTPKNELGRMLHEFSCTAYEIAGTDFFTLKELGLLNIDTSFTEEYQWNSINVIDIFKPSNFNSLTNNYNVNLGNKQVYGFACTGFEPGDIISFITDKSSDPLDITIGQTGTYLYDGPNIVVSLKVTPLYNRTPFSRDIQLKTKGFNYQKFDLITSIGIHTQMGQQIVGKCDNFFKKVIVGDPGYETANNVYLTEDFDQILTSQVTEDSFNENIGLWYLYENGKYRATTDSDEYINGRPYFLRKPVGEKIITYDLVHLHAKRREIIPIFLSITAADKSYRFNNNWFSSDDTVFSLTPFGNGYLYSQSIAEDPRTDVSYWEEKYSQLTLEERTRLISVNDLLDFTFKYPDIFDKFCLFDVYVPIFKNDKFITWDRYLNKVLNDLLVPDVSARNGIQGIFDPYLYEQQKSDTSILPIRKGWWQDTTEMEMVYDPSFTLVYSIKQNNEEKIITRNISLKDTQEITLQNTMTPINLSVGSGVIMELIYRLKFIDYSMEKEDGDVETYQAKSDYLNAKRNALNNMAQWRSDNYYKEAYAVLMIKYGEEIERLDKIENYSTIISALVNSAYEDQCEQIPNGYLINENKLLGALTLDLKEINARLELTLGKQYEDKTEEIDSKKKNCDDYMDDTLFIPEEHDGQTSLFPHLDYYLSNNYTIFDVINNINNIIDPILYHLSNNSNQNLFNTLSDMYNLCATREESKSIELINLPPEVTYVAQYQQYLNDTQRNNFFNTMVKVFDQEYPVGYWLHKGEISYIDFQQLKNDDAIVLSDYFHIGEEDQELPELKEISLIKKVTEDGKEIPMGYGIEGLDFYRDPENQIQKSEFYLIKTPDNPNQTIINYLIENLSNLNTDSNNVFNEESYFDTYGIEYSEQISEDLENLISVLREDTEHKISLGVFPNDTYIDVQKSIIESIIDLGNFQGAMFAINDEKKLEILEEQLKQSCHYYNEIPIPIRTILKQIIIKYVSPGVEEETKSFRQHYSEAITYSTYLKDHQSDFTDDEILYIKDQIDNYKRRRNSSEWTNLGIDQEISDFIDALLSWDDIRTGLGGTPNSALALKMNSYINELNKIIKAKRNIINSYRTINYQIQSLLNNDSLTPSTNIRDRLEEEIKIYGEGREALEELKNNYENWLLTIRTKGKILAYQDFLKDYFTLINTNNRFNTDSQYQEQIENLRIYKTKQPNSDQQPDKQQKIVTQAWATFLNLLAKDYEKMR